MPYKSLVEHIEKNRKELTKIKQEGFQLGFTEGEQRAIKEFLADLYKYKEQIGFQKHITLDLLIEKWEAKLDSSPGGKF